jgi:hypothetical protein
MKPNCEVLMDKCVEAIVKVTHAPCLKKIGKFYLFLYVNIILISKGCFNFNIRCHSFIADLPARAAFLNIKQFNGYYGRLWVPSR